MNYKLYLIGSLCLSFNLVLVGSERKDALSDITMHEQSDRSVNRGRSLLGRCFKKRTCAESEDTSGRVKRIACLGGSTLLCAVIGFYTWALYDNATHSYPPHNATNSTHFNERKFVV